MSDRAVRRAGAAAAIVGAVLGIVFNIVHPRSSGVGSVIDELRLVAESRIWRFDHFMLMWSIAFTLIGLVVIGRSFDKEPAASWGRVAIPIALVGGTLGLATIFADGMAVHDMATDWVANQSDVSLASATAVSQVTLALFTALIFVFFGLTPLLYGVAVLGSDEYPKGLGYLPIASGVLGLVAGSIQFMSGISQLTASILFPISSVATTVWLLLMGWYLWKRSAVPAPSAPRGVIG
ncbi:MAG TPA: hypothetical protein VHJ40_05745 [Actinomycetota bacterium]|nr:hypothetical protein [Actinomycetota bacterium]